jgi:hypothetical protein
MRKQSFLTMEVIAIIIVTLVSVAIIPFSLKAGVWEVTADAGDWIVQVDSLKTIAAGDTIMFVTDGGTYVSPTDITLPAVPLVFMAKSGLSEKPLIKTGYGQSRIFKVTAPVTVTGLRFEGDGIYKHPDSTADATPYLFRFDDQGNDFGTVVFDDCEFSRVRLRAMTSYENTWMDTLIINNCIFGEIGETGWRYNAEDTVMGVVKITNNTFYKCGGNAIYIRSAELLEFSHNTVFFADPSISGRSGAGVRARCQQNVIRDNIFVKQASYAVQVSGTSPTVEYNLFWDCGTTIESPDDTTLTFPIFNFEADPMFADTSAANLDLALDPNSPAVGVASDGTNLGDPRWGITTSVDANSIAPISYHLSQNYPNPFNPETVISYAIEKNGLVQLSIFNLLGQKIATLVDQNQNTGRYTVRWNGRDDRGYHVASGVYFYQIQAGEFVKVKKMIMMK